MSEQNTDIETVNVEGKVIVGTIASSEDNFFYELGNEMYKRSLTNLNDVLRQLLTSSLGLMGGSVAFLSAEMCQRELRIAALIMFFLAFSVALVGVHPYRRDAHFGCISDTKQQYADAIYWKDSFIWACSVFIALGLALAAVGVVVR